MGNELQQSRYDKLIRRVGAIIGPGSKVSEALPELFPVMDVENTPAELMVLMGTNLAGGARFMAATPAVNNRVQLFNPVDSGKLLTVTLISLQISSGSLILMGVVGTALASVSTTIAFRDSRIGTTNVPTGQVRFDQNATGAPDLFAIFGPSNVNQLLTDNRGLYVLGPGTGVQVSTSVVNVDLTVGFLWKERVAEESELNF